MKDAENTASRLNKIQIEFENQVLAADSMAAENQTRVAELKVRIITCIHRNYLSSETVLKIKAMKQWPENTFFTITLLRG